MATYSDPHDYWIVGYGRSGTKWLRRMVFDCLGHFIRERARPGPEHKGKIGLLHYHITPLPSEAPAIYLHRDPRDVIVSMSKYWLELGGIDGVLNHHPAPAPPPLEAIDKMHRYWLNGSRQIRLSISYAKLINETESGVLDVLRAFEIDPPDPQQMLSLLEYHEFDNYLGSLDENELLRITKWKGPRLGAWKDHLNREQGKRIHLHLWYWLSALGYENDPDWWRQLPVAHTAD